MGNQLRQSVLLLVIAPAVWAVPMCTSTTLDQYIGLNPGGCQIGNAIFSNFSYVYTRGLATSETIDPDVPASSVMVDVTGSPSSPTLDFLATWLASSGFQTQITLGYTVTALAPTTIIDTSAMFDGTVENLGGFPSNITTRLGISPAGIDLTPGLFPSSCGVAATTCTSSAGAGTGLNNLQQVTVGNLITLDSGGTGGSSPNTATLTEFDQTFVETPEPSTLAAVCLGLLLCGWMARNMRRA